MFKPKDKVVYVHYNHKHRATKERIDTISYITSSGKIILENTVGMTFDPEGKSCFKDTLSEHAHIRIASEEDLRNIPVQTSYHRKRLDNHIKEADIEKEANYDFKLQMTEHSSKKPRW